MNPFREAVVGVWCISWHPATDDVRFETLSSVLRNNLVAFEGRHKAILMIVGQHHGDKLTLTDEQGAEHHGVDADKVCEGFRELRRRGWAPAYYPVSIESAERWAWLIQD
jgi:hypothetical protein